MVGRRRLTWSISRNSSARNQGDHTLLAFAPFVTFTVLNQFVSPKVAKTAAALASFVLTAREVVTGRSAKILEVGIC
jgi:hypothetical protein